MKIKEVKEKFLKEEIQICFDIWQPEDAMKLFQYLEKNAPFNRRSLYGNYISIRHGVLQIDEVAFDGVQIVDFTEISFVDIDVNNDIVLQELEKTYQSLCKRKAKIEAGILHVTRVIELYKEGETL